MTTVHAEMIGDKVLIPRDEFECLVDLAKRTESVQLQMQTSDISTRDLMHLSEKGGSFDFWAGEGEDIYNHSDGEPL